MLGLLGDIYWHLAVAVAEGIGLQQVGCSKVLASRACVRVVWECKMRVGERAKRKEEIGVFAGHALRAPETPESESRK